MNEMLRGLGFDQVTNTKWTNGSTITIIACHNDLNMHCYGDVTDLITVDYYIETNELEDAKRHVEKFMRMVGKCIQVDEE